MQHAAHKPAHKPGKSPLAKLWGIDPEVVFLNHGSFGACPLPVLEKQRALRDRMERQLVKFLGRELEGLLDTARADVAAFVNADPDGLAFVTNATQGINAVLQWLPFAPGDEALTTNQEYNASTNALRAYVERAGGRVVVATVPFPIASEDEVVEAILSRVTDRTRLALIDHVTSPTGLVFPIERIVRALADRGIDTLVDGAHAPGMLPLDLEKLGAAYYVGNLHKWVCAPKGAAFLSVRADRRGGVRPTSISHGANSPRTDRARFRLEFDWTGTCDPTAWLAAPEAIRFMASVLPGGWPEVMERNRRLALDGRRILCSALGVPAPAPESMIGSLASIPLPDGDAEALKAALEREWSVEVPIVPWPAAPKRLVRISAQLHNHAAEYEWLAGALKAAL